MNKENKYLGNLKGVKIHPVKKPLSELATVGLRLNKAQIKKLATMLEQAISNGAESLVLTGHRAEHRVTVLFE